jgi:CheY-like chemotaxis protein
MKIKKSIILAEDEHVSRLIFQHISYNLGYTCVVCSDGLQAYNMIVSNNQNYGYIFTDIMMPNLDGIGLAKKLKFELKSRTPLIAISSLEADGIGSYKNLFDWWIMKPLNELKVKECLDYFENLGTC